MMTKDQMVREARAAAEHLRGQADEAVEALRRVEQVIEDRVAAHRAKLDKARADADAAIDAAEKAEAVVKEHEQEAQPADPGPGDSTANAGASAFDASIRTEEN